MTTTCGTCIDGLAGPLSIGLPAMGSPIAPGSFILLETCCPWIPARRDCVVVKGTDGITRAIWTNVPGPIYFASAKVCRDISGETLCTAPAKADLAYWGTSAGVDLPEPSVALQLAVSVLALALLGRVFGGRW